MNHEVRWGSYVEWRRVNTERDEVAIRQKPFRRFHAETREVHLAICILTSICGVAISDLGAPSSLHDDDTARSDLSINVLPFLNVLDSHSVVAIRSCINFGCDIDDGSWYSQLFHRIFDGLITLWEEVGTRVDMSSDITAEGESGLFETASITIIRVTFKSSSTSGEDVRDLKLRSHEWERVVVHGVRAIDQLDGVKIFHPFSIFFFIINRSSKRALLY